MLPDLHPVTHIITSGLLALGYTWVMVIALVISIRMRVYGLLVLLFFALPWATFYALSCLDLFPSSDFAIAYSRLAHASSILSITIGLLMMSGSAVKMEHNDHN